MLTTFYLHILYVFPQSSVPVYTSQNHKEPHNGLFPVPEPHQHEMRLNNAGGSYCINKQISRQSMSVKYKLIK
jgi:hypothetical protein